MNEEKITGTEKEFLDVFRQLCISRSSWQVWADLMAAMACTLANSVDKTEPRHTAREKEYAECIKRLGGVEKPAKCFAIVVEALESLTPIVREAVKRLGFREICLDENQDAVRAHFFKIYSTLIERKTNDAKLPPSILEAKNKYIAQLTTHENAAIEQQHRDQIEEEPERATPEYIDMLMREHGFKR